MRNRDQVPLSPSEAAARLCVSPKALRVYEDRGLLTPLRTEAGWRVYGPQQIARAELIVALRGLDMSLAQIETVLSGSLSELDAALAAHADRLENKGRNLAAARERIGRLRAGLAAGAPLSAADIQDLEYPSTGLGTGFNLPWPWDGEWFEIRHLPLVTFLVGPLGSGKTRLACAIAKAVPGGRFLGLDRTDGPPDQTDPEHAARVADSMDWLAGDGATRSPALTALVSALVAPGRGPLVIDLIEKDLDEPTQRALAAYLRRRHGNEPPIVAMTRSTAILDLAFVGPDQAILYCPANHGVPITVLPYPGSPGFEALASCLASPAVRARTKTAISATGITAADRFPSFAQAD